MGWWILILREKDGEKKDDMLLQITLISDDKKVIKSIWSFYGLVILHFEAKNVMWIPFLYGTLISVWK